MKSIRLAVGVAVFGSLALVSCKKDYTCTCNTNGVYFIHYQYSHTNKDAATAQCAADEALLEQEYQTNFDCSI